MKVLVCIPCLMTGGTEIQTLNLVRALVTGGHKVLTVCYFEYASEMVSRFQQVGSEVICLSKDGSRIGGWKGIIFLYKGLRKILKQYRPEVAHVQYMAPGAIPILLLRLLGIPKIIATAHTPADIYSSLRLVHFVQRHCVRAFTCITELAERSFFGTSQLYTEQAQLKKRNHFTIYNALPAGISISKQAKKYNQPLTIGVVSRLETIKGMDLVVPAFAQVKASHTEMKLLVVGDGSLRKLMDEQVYEAKLEEAVEFTGQQPQEKLSNYYDRIDILLMPSRSEGFGLTAIEGMARGCVVVASRVGGLPEVVRDREVGLLHVPEQIGDLADKINELVEHPLLWKQYSIKATTYVQRFSLAQYIKLFNNLYNKI
ncbi:glycosyltransferase family 4 protein [Phocaeicola sp. HCN-6420]|uniref:glycosyltransferase family 4 protein n=1 Tax=Phocaeicola sp. HCN-6420 TaxID=3134673 RepID=UPI0030BD6833